MRCLEMVFLAILFFFFGFMAKFLSRIEGTDPNHPGYRFIFWICIFAGCLAAYYGISAYFRNGHEAAVGELRKISKAIREDTMLRLIARLPLSFWLACGLFWLYSVAFNSLSKDIFCASKLILAGLVAIIILFLASSDGLDAAVGKMLVMFIGCWVSLFAASMVFWYLPMLVIGEWPIEEARVNFAIVMASITGYSSLFFAVAMAIFSAATIILNHLTKEKEGAG